MKKIWTAGAALALIMAIAPAHTATAASAESKKAATATERYEQLQARRAPAGSDPEKASAAQTYIGADPADAANCKGDIRGYSLAYTSSTLVGKVNPGCHTNPDTDANWVCTTGGTTCGVTELWLVIDATGDGFEDYAAVMYHEFDGALTAEVFNVTDSGLTPACSATPGHSTEPSLSITIPSSCIGSPASIRSFWDYYWDNDPSSEECVCADDFAPDEGLGPVVYKDTPPVDGGYWMLGETGIVYAFGGAPDVGYSSLFDAVDIESTPDSKGHWVVDSAGGVSTKGNAGFHGHAKTNLAPGEKAASISSTKDGGGYYIFTDRGRVFTFGNAIHRGDMSTFPPLNGPVLDSIVTASGLGYFMVASDGGIFAFGDAMYRGSMGGKFLVGPVVGLAPDPDNLGYWLVANDGGIFAFDAGFRGSMGGIPLNRPVIGMVAYGNGYLMVGSDGGIFNFSNKPFHGSLGGKSIPAPIAAVTPVR